MKRLLKDVCNCYEEIERMINEGGRVDLDILVKKNNFDKRADS